MRCLPVLQYAQQTPSNSDLSLSLFVLLCYRSVAACQGHGASLLWLCWRLCLHLLVSVSDGGQRADKFSLVLVLIVRDDGVTNKLIAILGDGLAEGGDKW